MPPPPIRSSKDSTPKKIEKPKEDKLQIDVDDALIDDEHPKDTIQGGPPDKNPSHKT
jgi:hypothetical protein